MNAHNYKKDFGGKTVLILSSGTERNRFVFNVVNRLGLKTVVLNDRVNWSKRLADDFILADNFNHAQVLNVLRSYFLKHKVAGVVTFSEENVELLTKVCHEFNFIGNGRTTAGYLRNKYAMRQRFAAWQIDQPNFALVTNDSELQIAIAKVGFPAIIKPVAGTGGDFVVKVTDKHNAQEIFDFIKKNATPKFDPIFFQNQYQFLYEKYLPGAEVSVEAVTQNGQTDVVAIVDKQTGDEPYFVDYKHSLPSKLDSEEQEMVERLVFAAHRALGIMNGITHTEIIMRKDRPAIIEVAGQMGSQYIWDGVRTTWGVDLVEQAFRVALGLPITTHQRALEPKKYWACQYLEIEKSGIVAAIHGADEVAKIKGVRDLYLDKEVGDAVLVPPLSFDTIGWLAAEGESHSEVDDVVSAGVDKLEIQTISFDAESSVGQSERRNNFSSAFVMKKKYLAQARVEKLRRLDIKNLRGLHVGILGNVYKNNSKTTEKNEIAGELMSVGYGVQKVLQERGYRVSFFDMNESPLPWKKSKNQVWILFLMFVSVLMILACLNHTLRRFWIFYRCLILVPIL